MDTGEIRTQLLRRRDEIMSVFNQVAKHVTHREEPLDRAAGERALELENLDALFAIDRETRHELRQINDAIERIDSDRYGFCSSCGVAIDKARLAVLPYADTCIRCAQQAESAGCA